MKIRYVLIVCSLATLAVGALALSQPSQEETKQTIATQAQERSVPEHVVYRHLFHQVFVLNNRAENVERQGDDTGAASLRTVYKRQANLNEDQVSLLNEIASECEREVNQQDAKAKVIIDAFLARYPDGRVPSGEKPSPPSPELEGLQAERNAIILRSRDRLQEAFGDKEFSRFKKFMQLRVAPNVQVVVPGQR